MAIKKPGADPEISNFRLETPSLDKHYSLESEDDIRPGCRSVSHQQQFFSELPSPGRLHYKYLVNLNQKQVYWPETSLKRASCSH